jgi:uroporphyrinogen III methyltransferase/synthase
VILVGAGPGDPGLLTLRGAAALSEADVVIHDELSPSELLDLVPASAQRINVGKHGHDAPTRPQEDVHKLLIDHARAGRTVVRLKGGDPFVFGRGGEEASACSEAGVPFEVIPGVTSAIEALAYAGIPVTDRRHSASFAVVTGHKDPTRVAAATRWAELGRAVDTLVILMGMRNLPEIVSCLLADGKDPDTPAAVVMHGSLPQQQVVEARLADLPERVRAEGLCAPAAVVVGDVVRLRETLAWWESLPLFGNRVLVTRAADQATEMIEALRAQGAEAVHFPMVRIAPVEDTGALDSALAELDAYDAVVFTSANAVRFFAEAANRSGLDPGALAPRVACIGAKTARAAALAGLPIHFVPGAQGAGDAESFFEELASVIPPAGKRFLLPRSELGRELLPERLRTAGAQVDTVTVYRNLPPDDDRGALKRELVAGAIQTVIFTSPSAVEHLLERVEAEGEIALRHCTIAAIGPTTVEALRRAGFEADVVPERPDSVELVRALAQHSMLRKGEER